MKIFYVLFIQFFISINISILNALRFPNMFKYISPAYVASKVLEDKTIINNPTITQKYDMSWYVVGETKEIKINYPFKATIWSKDYVIWRTPDKKFHALEDVCPHKGSALSIGTIQNDHIVCPYHGYEFNNNGNLTVVPGICFHSSEKYNIPKFSVVEKHGWIYLNTYEIPSFITEDDLSELNKNSFIHIQD
jgi:nitrite reductase/ring-hydroxylating ferredoxin subunit